MTLVGTETHQSARPEWRHDSYSALPLGAIGLRDIEPPYGECDVLPVDDELHDVIIGLKRPDESTSDQAVPATGQTEQSAVGQSIVQPTDSTNGYAPRYSRALPESKTPDQPEPSAASVLDGVAAEQSGDYDYSRLDLDRNAQMTLIEVIGAYLGMVDDSKPTTRHRIQAAKNLRRTVQKQTNYRL